MAFIVFCFLPETKAWRPPRLAGGLWTYLDLRGVQPQFDAFALGVGEHIRQGPQPQVWPPLHG
ncbi:hypothetical protein ADK75_07255 [Streptomyces virginiae]|uniref:Uncharacterized protein n=1 Tax=Streptomyces virginiae TaxID=1961 RepID=A0A0L8N226_STRVG|nr:hypothetical protein ADK75_07255 [Streptomyces virginiae]